MSKPVVGIIMGSQSDLKIMREAAEFLEELKIPFELTVVSAHRTPQRMVDYASSARLRGLNWAMRSESLRNSVQLTENSE